MHLQIKTVSSPAAPECRPTLAIEPSTSVFPYTESGPLRILLIVESSACGTGRHILDLADGIISRGHHVHVVHSTIRIDQLFQKRLATVAGLTCTALPMRTAPHPSDFGIVRTIRKLKFVHGPFDVIHGHSSKGGALARFAAVGTRAKAFYTPHGLICLDLNLPWWKYGFYVSIERALALLTHGIIAVSPEEERAAASIGLSRKKIINIPNGLETLALAPRKVARHAIGVSGEEIVVGYVGRLVEQKAPDILLQSFAKASATTPNAKLAIVGAGPLAVSLRALADKLGVSEKIIWLGERDAREVLAGFDLFALASRKEGLPYVILEAMAAGLPVVATRNSGAEILIEPGVNGIVVPTNDVDALATALAELLENPAKTARFGIASKARVGHFSIEKMVDSTIAFYRRSLVLPPEAEGEIETGLGTA